MANCLHTEAQAPRDSFVQISPNLIANVGAAVFLIWMASVLVKKFTRLLRRKFPGLLGMTNVDEFVEGGAGLTESIAASLARSLRLDKTWQGKIISLITDRSGKNLCPQRSSALMASEDPVSYITGEDSITLSNVLEAIHSVEQKIADMQRSTPTLPPVDKS